MELYNLDNRYKKFVETLVDGYVLGKSHMEDGSNPYISNPGIEVCNIFCDITDDFLCNLIFHKESDKSINVCYVFDSRLINSEDGDRYEAEERFIKIKRADFIYKLTLLKWLEDSGYIVMIDDSNYNLFETGHITEHDRKKWDDSGFLCIEKTENSEFVYKTLSRYHNCRIIPSAQLIDIRNNDFKTIEQRRFERELQVAKETLKDTKEALITSQKALKVSNYSFVIAICSLIATIIFGFWQTCAEQTINHEQIDSITSAIKGNNLVVIDSVKIHHTDTVKVEVEEPNNAPIDKSKITSSTETTRRQ